MGCSCLSSSIHTCRSTKLGVVSLLLPTLPAIVVPPTRLRPDGVRPPAPPATAVPWPPREEAAGSPPLEAVVARPAKAILMRGGVGDEGRVRCLAVAMPPAYATPRADSPRRRRVAYVRAVEEGDAAGVARPFRPEDAVRETVVAPPLNGGVAAIDEGVARETLRGAAGREASLLRLRTGEDARLGVRRAGEGAARLVAVTGVVGLAGDRLRGVREAATTVAPAEVTDIPAPFGDAGSAEIRSSPEVAVPVRPRQPERHGGRRDGESLSASLPTGAPRPLDRAPRRTYAETAEESVVGGTGSSALPRLLRIAETAGGASVGSPAVPRVGPPTEGGG